MRSNSVKRVIYVDFVGEGGMFHYAKNLNNAASQYISCDLVLPIKRVEVDNQENVWHRRFSSNTIIKKLIEKYNPWYFYRLADRVIDIYRPDVIHIVTSTTGILSFVTRVKKRGIKIILTIHDPLKHHENRTLWGIIFEKYTKVWALPRVLKLCCLIHIHSKKHKKEIELIYGKQIADKAYVVAHGGGATDEVLSGKEKPTELKCLQNRAFVFLFFGRIHPYKGLDVLIPAFKAMTNLKSDCFLVIAGEGSLDIDVKCLGEKCIVINRFIDDSEIRSIFEYSDVVVLPYLSATQTGVIPLASTFSKTVICTDVGALKEMISEGVTGQVIRSDNVCDLTSAMLYMTSNIGRTIDMGNAAKAYIEDNFSWGIIAKKHIKIYQDRYVI